MLLARVRAGAPLLVAAALAVVAVVTVEQAGCDDPGRYELRADGYELVGGCVAPGDLVVPDPTPVRPGDDKSAPDRS
jgi:hypothetical protein